MHIFTPVNQLARSRHTSTHLMVDVFVDLLSGRPRRPLIAPAPGFLVGLWCQFCIVIGAAYQAIAYGVRPSRETFTGPVPRRIRRVLVRRRVRTMLAALGDTPDIIVATLTMHWQHACAEHVALAEQFTPLEWYLAVRLGHDDIFIGPWTWHIGGTTVAHGPSADTWPRHTTSS